MLGAVQAALLGTTQAQYVFEDRFTQPNGQSPDAAKWDTVKPYGTIVQTTDIQNSRLQFAISSSTQAGVFIRNKNAWGYALGRKYEIDAGAVHTYTQFNDILTLCNADPENFNAAGHPYKSFLAVRRDNTGKLEVYSYNSSGTASALRSMSSDGTGGAAAKYTLKITAANKVMLYINNVFISEYTLTFNMSALLHLGVFVHHNSANTAVVSFDNVLVY